MLRRVVLTAVPVALVVVVYLGVFRAPKVHAARTYPPLRIEVKAHVKANQADSYIEEPPKVDICALAKGQYGQNPATLCDRAYEVNWYVTFVDPTGACGANVCSVALTQKGKPRMNRNLFSADTLSAGDNVRAPGTWANYTILRKRRYGYALQIKLGSNLIGKLLDPDIMPHPPGG